MRLARSRYREVIAAFLSLHRKTWIAKLRQRFVAGRIVRPEQEIFDDLAALCASPGYAHAIAYLCFRDNVVGYGSSLKPEDYVKLFSTERLIRTEVSTLIGLMVRAPLDLTMPDRRTLNRYIKRTESLLKELHEAFNEPFRAFFQKALSNPEKAKDLDPFTDAAVLREPIFYGAESAYTFQYRDLSVDKYARDDSWLKAQKDFTPAEARTVVATLSNFLNAKLFKTLEGLRKLPPKQWSVLSGFQFTIADITTQSGLPAETVRAVVDAFTCPDSGNPTFTALNEFNAVNAFPILRGDGEDRILFLYTSLTEALYETPFYWMSDDKAYRPTAMDNRGAFTEEFAAKRLERVFGADKVFRNIDIWQTKAKKTKLGEIDVLVLIGDRAIVVQAKSKKLTLAARKGNDLQLRADFKSAVQDACDQAVLCSEHLLKGTSFLADSSGNEVSLAWPLMKVHPVCVVSDHYPALSFQARQFLKFKPAKHIELPLVCDVFFIDVATEFLETPLRFLSYLELRARAGNNISLSHENVALGYHLRQNLWLGEYDHIVLEDDLSANVDIAMAARRDGIEGETNPSGILTALKGTAVGRIIEEIENCSEPGAIATGLELLKLSSTGTRDLNTMIDKIVADAAIDGRGHDATVYVGQAGSGITVHCNSAPDEAAASKLRGHSILRKYATKANLWFGLALRPGSGAVRFGLMLDDPWEQDTEMDVAVADLPEPKPMATIRQELKKEVSKKIGRNHPCPCGSGRKYKKCHLPKGGIG